MIRKLYEPDLPQNERRSHAQLAVELTKRKAYKECMGIGGCRGAIEGGHVIPRSWLRKICDEEGQVQVFSTLPLLVFRKDMDSQPCFPISEHLNNAFVGSFTCRRHEEMFGPIDDPEPDLSGHRSLNLMLYKPIIATLWGHKLLLRQAEAKLTEVPQSELFQAEVKLHRQQVIGLEYYKQQTERCLSPQTCKNCRGGRCKVIGHTVFHVPGEPALAVSDFSDGIRTRTNPRFNSVEYIMNWGMTVLPHSKGHKVIFHHFIEEERIAKPIGQLLSRWQGKKLQGEISYRILKSFERIAISPRRWEQFGETRRSAMLGVFANEVPDIGFGILEDVRRWERDRFKPDMPAPNPHQINLFNPNKR